MPRGIYDRSKLKSKKVEGAPASAKKTWSRKAKTASPVSHTASPSHVQSEGGTLAELRQHLATLTVSRQQVANNAIIVSKIDAQITKTIDQLNLSFDESFPARQLQHETEEEITTPTPAARAGAPAQGPVPFTPPYAQQQ